MIKEKIKKYDLNIKLIFTIFILCIVTISFSIYIAFFASIEEQIRYHYIMMITIKQHVPFVSGIFLIPYVIYLIALLIYKRKSVLVIYENRIEYYSLKKGKIVIEQQDIIDIYVTNKLVIKYKANNETKILNIDLMYIKCDKDEIRQEIIKFKPENEIIKNLLSNILKEYNIKNVFELKDNPKAFEDCVIRLYNMNELTQLEIATLLNTNSTKVSKIIRKSIK